MSVVINTKDSFTKEIHQFQELKRKRIGSRKYQIDAYDALCDKFLNDDNRVAGLLVLPTGGGKTRVSISWAIDKAINQGFKILWLAHRHMLLDQAYNTFCRFSGLTTSKDQLQIRIVSGKSNHSSAKEINYNKDDIVVASIQTLDKSLRNNKFDNIDKLLVIVDEAHHAQSQSYDEWIGLPHNKKSGWFRKQYEKRKFQKLKILGLTATPINTSTKKEEHLKAIFDNKEALYKISTSELMKLGILSQPILHPISTNNIIDIDANSFEADTEKQLEDSINKQLAENVDRNHFIVETYKQAYQDGKTLIFAVNIDHADMLQGFFKNDGFNCETIYILKRSWI